MRSPILRLIACAALALLMLRAAWGAWIHRPLDPGPGVLAPQDPQQVMLPPEQAPEISVDGYTLKPVARYSIRARVLSRENYSMGREADLSPVDFALGWGPMSDSAVLAPLEISQAHRFFFVRWHSALPISEQELFRHAANTHLIPATRAVASQLDRVRPGEVVQLDGKLVNASAPDGWYWLSSQSRDDTGAGACELMWVDDVARR